MTFILNEYDVEDSVRRAINADMPNAEKGARILRNLVDLTNANSDGWPYFRKPSQAATKLQTLLRARFFSAWDKRVKEDITDEQLDYALRPIKALVTRQGWDKDRLMKLDYS